MRCDTRLAVIVPAVITIILGGLQIYTFSCHEDIDVSLHHKHKKGDGKQHRAYDHELLQKSHSTLTEEESFDEKIKADYDHKVEDHKTEEKIHEEEKELKHDALHHDTVQRTVKIVGTVISIISIITSCITFATAGEDNEKNCQRKNLLLPYIIFHLLLVVMSLILTIYLIVVTNTNAIPIMVIGIIIYGKFVAFMIWHYVRLRKGMQNCDDAFDYAQMENEKKIQKH